MVDVEWDGLRLVWFRAHDNAPIFLGPSLIEPAGFWRGVAEKWGLWSRAPEQLQRHGASASLARLYRGSAGVRRETQRQARDRTRRVDVALPCMHEQAGGNR